MSFEKVLANAKPFGIPLRHNFRNTDSRTGLLIEGPSGWGEFAPFADYNDEVAGRWLAAALEQSHGTWPNANRSEIPINGILPIVDVETTKTLTQEILDPGITTLKIKVHDGSENALSHDIERIAAVREVAGMEAKIRVDVNGAWSVKEAASAIQAILPAAGALDYVEQPCRTIEELGELHKKLDGIVRIAVDESIRLAEKVDAPAIREVADVVIVKAIPLGGVTAALEIAEVIGLPIVVSGSLDTSVGLSAGLQLAGCIENLYGACGLGTGLLLAGDVVKKTLSPENGVTRVGRVAPDLEPLEHWHTSSNVASEWFERAMRAWEASAIHLVSNDVREAVLG